MRLSRDLNLLLLFFAKSFIKNSFLSRSTSSLGRTFYRITCSAPLADKTINRYADQTQNRRFRAQIASRHNNGRKSLALFETRARCHANSLMSSIFATNQETATTNLFNELLFRSTLGLAILSVSIFFLYLYKHSRVIRIYVQVFLQLNKTNYLSD